MVRNPASKRNPILAATEGKPDRTFAIKRNRIVVGITLKKPSDIMLIIICNFAFASGAPFE